MCPSRTFQLVSTRGGATTFYMEGGKGGRRLWKDGKWTATTNERIKNISFIIMTVFILLKCISFVIFAMLKNPLR